MPAAWPEVTLTGKWLVDRQLSELNDAFPWESLKNGKVVDIEGGSGHISIAIARVKCSPLFTVVASH